MSKIIKNDAMEVVQDAGGLSVDDNEDTLIPNASFSDVR